MDYYEEMLKSYDPCDKCQHKKGYLMDACFGTCRYANKVRDFDEFEKKSNKINRKMKDTLFKLRLCPECGKQITFRIRGSFYGTIGIFNCECGYKDESTSNFKYATEDEYDEYRNATKNTMW